MISQKNRKDIYDEKTMCFLRTGAAYPGCTWYPRMQHKAGHRVNCFEKEKGQRKGRRERGRKKEKKERRKENTKTIVSD